MFHGSLTKQLGIHRSAEVAIGLAAVQRVEARVTCRGRQAVLDILCAGAETKVSWTNPRGFYHGAF